MKEKNQKLFERLTKTTQRAGRKIAYGAACLWYVALDPETPKHIQATALGPLVYLVNPIDAIPDITPFIGFSDDATVIAGAVALLAMRIRARHKVQARALVTEWLGSDKKSKE